MEALQVDISQQGRTALLTLVGPLTAKHVAALRRASFELERRGDCAHCVLDMTDVEEIDGYGLSTLVGMLARRGSQSGKVVLFGLRPDLKSRFEATFCDCLLPLRPTLAGALELLPDAPPCGEPEHRQDAGL